MTTHSKGRKFRIRRGFGPDATARVSDPEGEADETAAEPDTNDAPERNETTEAEAEPEAKGDTEKAEAAVPEEDAANQPASEAETPKFAGGAKRKNRKSAPTPPEPKRDEDAEIAAIRAEGLTGRQLRMARRTALKHKISASSDYDAVRQLRDRGIDPFARTNMLELIVTDPTEGTAADQTAAPGVPAPRKTTEPVAPKPAMTPGPIDKSVQAAEIMQVQRDIASRRRRRLALLGVRLLFFVLLPTFIAGIYFYRIATPLYATNSEFVIQKAEGGSSGGGALGGLLGGTSFATVQESISVQSFLESRGAMLRLDEELGFRSVFSAPEIDPLIRIAPDASAEDMYDIYRRNLDIGYDPTEGLVRMEIRAPDPEISRAWAEALIGYAEENVDQMSQRVREDQMSGASDSFDAAEEQLRAAQQRVLQLQEQRGVLSTEAEVSTVFGQISTFELQLQEERLRLAELLSVDRPNQTRVEVAERNIERLESVISDLRSGLTEDGGEDVSLARIQSELIVAQADLETRQLILAQALQQMETARIEANRQSLYLSISVYPVPPDDAAYPKALENTLLTFLVFAGVYLLLSMTAAILREQVSA